MPLFVFSAIVPATWVPWPLRSSGSGALVDEVVALDELAGGEVGAAAEAAAQRPVGDPGVEHRDRDPARPRALGGDQVFPGADRVDAAGRERQQRECRPFPGEEVPLLRHPVAGDRRAARSASRGRWGCSPVLFRPRPIPSRRSAFLRRGGRDVVGRRVLDRRVAAQGGGGRVDADPGRQLLGAGATRSPANLTITWRGANSRAGERPAAAARPAARAGSRAGQGRGRCG